MGHVDRLDATRRPGLAFCVGLVFLLLSAHTTADSPSPIPPSTPTILSAHVLEDAPLTLPPDAGADARALGFRMGGISDLVVVPGDDGAPALWGVTDRGPNGMVPKPGTPGDPADMLRTLPVPAFVPLLVRMEIEPASGDASCGSLRILESRPITTSGGAPTSGRPAIGPPRGKAMVDPASTLALPVDPNGIDSEGLAPFPGGGFWLAEEYAPSLVHLDAEGRAVRRFVPVGIGLDGAGCDVIEALPASAAKRRDNRGFEALAIAPDGSRLFAMLQSPPEASADAPPDAQRLVPLYVLDAADGTTVRELSYPLGAADEPTAAVVAADGKISAMAAHADGRLLVLEQSATASRIYAVDPGEDHEGVVHKTLVADLAPLAARFAADITPGSRGAPDKLSDLKFEGLAILAPAVVAIVNDNDFDMDAAGAAPASPPLRRTCLWVVALDAGNP